MNKNDLKEIIAHFGKEKQIDKLLEELGELITAVIKFKLGDKDIDDVLDEIADVHVMIDQFLMINHINHINLIERKKFKIERTLNRIKK